MNSESTQRYCAFCGLPLPKTFSLGRDRSFDETDYCCSGCRSVATVQESEAESGTVANGLLKLGLAIFFTMNVMVFTMALWSQDIYSEQAFTSEFSQVLRSVFRWASLLFSFPVLWLLGGPIAEGVWQALKRKTITTDLLILCGVLAAYGFSVVSVLRGAGHVYFEVGTMVLVFVSLGRWLEAKGKRQTSQSLDALADLLPTTVLRREDSGSFQASAREEIITGDIVRVLAGERLPVDGIIRSGAASIDEQMVTGESHPIEKRIGATVYSGTLNLDGDLQIEVTAADGRETVSRLIAMIRTAREMKGRQEILADRIAAYFVPLVALIALIAATYHWQAFGFEQGILIGLTVVLIACPCALGLATPMAVWTAFGRAAEGGVLFRSGMVMQKLADIQTACFDKTGTLTSGSLEVTNWGCATHESPEEISELTFKIATGSTHPLSKSIVAYLHSENATSVMASETVQTIPGKGLCSEIPPHGRVALGSRRLMNDQEFTFPENLQTFSEQNASDLAVYLGFSGQVRAMFLFAELPRPEVSDALATCRELGLEMQLLSGDTDQRVATLGAAFGLSAHSQQLPDGKIAIIQQLKRNAKVAMIGDGLNDAPALAAADVGVALGCGADVSRDSAGVCLMSDDLRRFPWAIGLSRLTNRVVAQNLFWAFSYNCIGIALAATGRLNPILAASAMALSSLLVITNSLRIKRYPDLLPHAPAPSVAGVTALNNSQVAPPKTTKLPSTPTVVATSG